MADLACVEQTYESRIGRAESTFAEGDHMTSPADYEQLAKRLRFQARQMRPVTAQLDEMNKVRKGLAFVMDSLATLTESVAAIDQRRS